jgi:p-hydroxybenzoate 3-monooxygenase
MKHLRISRYKKSKSTSAQSIAPHDVASDAAGYPTLLMLIPVQILRTQVVIVGAGPAGLLLSQLLRFSNISCVILERQSRDHVESRVRAGVLETGTVELLEKVGVGQRMRREGLSHDGFLLAYDDELFRVDMNNLTGGSGVMIYGQTELTKDLIDAAITKNTPIVFEAKDVTPYDIQSAAPFVTYRTDKDELVRLECDFVAGCDGFHGVCRNIIAERGSQVLERTYPFGWLGILAEVPPCNEELIYSNHERGFALASMRSRTRSRYYIQCAVNENLDDWPDEKIWDELAIRLGPDAAAHMIRGPSFEKSIAPLRSLVSETLNLGRLFLAGDSAHIVPPTGAKGLNLAASDVRLLAEAIIAYYNDSSERFLAGYSDKALARVWQAERFSWWFTGITHRFPNRDAFDRKIQLAELDYIKRSRAAQTSLAENYVGLPLER